MSQCFSEHLFSIIFVLPLVMFLCKYMKEMYCWRNVMKLQNYVETYMTLKFLLPIWILSEQTTTEMCRNIEDAGQAFEGVYWFSRMQCVGRISFGYLP